jgi:hypothetical protein
MKLNSKEQLLLSLLADGRRVLEKLGPGAPAARI